MPNYSLRDKKTGETEVVSMSYSDLEKHLEANPNLEHVFWETCRTGDPWLLGVQKPPSDFTKYILGRVKEKTPGSENMISNVQIPREW